MSYSLNEVEATAKRATRGAGYGWGMAEESGRATRWLCAQGLDGASELVRVLERGFAGSVADHMPSGGNTDWTGARDLCPLMTGAALSDWSDLLRAGPIRIERLARPMILIPFAAFAARCLNTVVTVRSGDFSAATDGAQLAIENECPAVAAQVLVTAGGSLTNPSALQSRATPDPAAWDMLNRFAHRTYAPATEESRLLGAGAGLSDND